MDTYRCPVVFEVGSSTTRVGLSRDFTPKTFPTLVTKFNDEIRIGGQGTKVRVLDLDVQNFDHMKKIWEHGFDLLKIDPKEHPLLLNKPNYPSPKMQNEKMAQIMFEDFTVPALHLNYPAALALYGHGSKSGLVVDSGFGETQFYPVYEGHILESAITRGLQVAGNYLTSSLLKVLQKNGSCDYTTAEDIKNQSLYISMDVAMENPSPQSFVLENGNTVTVSTEKFTLPEELYTPRSECCGIHEHLLNTLYRCDPEMRQTLFRNILLTGGNTQLPGFAARLEKEIKNAVSYKYMQNERPRITVSDNPQNLAWIGGTKLASLPTFLNTCMTIEEYNEYGPGLVHTKFF